MKHISLFAAAGAYNLGDECIVLAEYDFLRKRYGDDAVIHIFTYDSKSTLLPKTDSNIVYESYFPNAFRSHPLRNIFAFLKTCLVIAKSSLVVIGGGGIFYDSESGQSFARLVSQWKFRVSIAKFFRKPILFFGVWVEVSEKNVAKLAPIFSGDRTIVTVRDPKSVELLRKIGIEALEVPDPAFLTPPQERLVRVWQRPIVGISIRKGYISQESKAIPEILDFLDREGFDVVFLNHSFHPGDEHSDDASFVDAWAKQRGIPSTQTIEETFEAYKYLSFVIAMRLHAWVLSAVNSIPFFLLSYSKKTDEFGRKLGHEYVMSTRNFSQSVFEARFLAMTRGEDAAIFALREKCDTIGKTTLKNYSQILYGLE